jgi:hypothetical protein
VHPPGYDPLFVSPKAIVVVVTVALAPGCFSPVTELITPHVEAGGTIAAALGSGPPLTVKALADGTVDPMTINGASPELVFGLIIGTDTLSGMPAKALLLAGKTVQLTVAGGSQLSVHLAGASCATTTATVNLRPDGKGHIDGDFTGTGASCSTSGTLASVPIDH